MEPMCNPPHPGVTLLEGWLAEGSSAEAAADSLGVRRERIAEVLDGRRGIAPELAQQLESSGWLNAALWMRVQASCDLAQARLGTERSA